ncbi:Conserved_hypothetical protein [Hexamita inflata]|uniref:Uncharacterized protein n=1 Tax=Hexamita inflata TaxID=28002 RepID=A0AA86TNU1_9EUKA|nr:Conserved hypothetical protein [Hexamita inflata]
MSHLRTYYDPNNEQQRITAQNQQQMLKQQLDEQKQAQPPPQEKFRDGRMSDEEYLNYEKSSQKRFKEMLLIRMERNLKDMSTFDKIEAAEIAKQDPEFAEKYNRIMNGSQTKQQKDLVKEDYVPQKISKLDKFKKQLNQPPQILDNIPSSPSLAQTIQLPEPVPETRIETVQAPSPPQNQQFQPQYQQFQQMPMYYPPPQESMMPQMLQLMSELQNQKLQIAHLQQREENAKMEQMQNHIQNLERALQQKEQQPQINSELQLELKRIQKEKEEMKQILDKIQNQKNEPRNQTRDQFQQQMNQISEPKQQMEFAKPGREQVLRTKEGYSLQDLQERNEKRKKLLQMVVQEFNQ